MRLQKYLAHAGIASRRKCEEYILEGKVTVNGDVITELGTKVSEDDEILFEGRSIKQEEKLVYYVLNKPTGYITSAKDEKNRKTVLDLMSEVEERVFPIGRLDYNTSGLLLLTNDGDLTYQLTHPKHNVNKTYVAKVRGYLTDEECIRLEKGVIIDNRVTAPAQVEKLYTSGSSSRLKITIHEGRNRQVRKMCEAVGHEVITLRRIAIGDLKVEDIKEGKWRRLTESEVNYLKRLGGNHVK